MTNAHILVIEDNPDHQELIRAALADAEAELDIHFANTGTQACRLIRAGSPFDCVILDFNLAEQTAVQVLPSLHAAGCRCPALVISSDSAQDIVIKSLRGGSVDFLRKDDAFRGDQLWSRVELALTRWRQAEAQRRRIDRRTKQLSKLAEQDPLTGLSNRRCLPRVFQRRRRTPDRRGHTALVMLDLDRFKTINDTYGHPVGDRVLLAVADTLRAATTEADTVCRYGGEEFLIVRPATTGAEAFWWTEQLRAEIAGLVVTTDRGTLNVTASFGVLSRPSGGLTPDAVAQADQALYLAKTLGRNRTCTWEQVMVRMLVERVLAECSGSPEVKLFELLRQAERHLGPTGYHHVTTHAVDVARMAVRLGQMLDLDSAQLARLRLAGLCHDLGKLGVPEAVLAKPAPLSLAEKALLARHAAEGAELARLLGADETTVEHIRLHHTPYAPGGPRSYAEADHPALGARIMAVAEALIAMTSFRTYAETLSFTAALRELRRESGRKFDPGVLAVAPRALLVHSPLAPVRAPVCETV